MAVRSVWLVVGAAFAVQGGSLAHALNWTLQDAGVGCEPPEIFYSSAHDPSITTPCCPRNPERCPGGVSCVAGFCAAPYESVACSAPTGTDAPNILFVLNDDQGYCHYGFMGPACRSEKQALFVPVPATPNLDRLALQPENQGRGRIFEISYSNAAWSAPSRETLQMGQLRKDVLDPNVPPQFLAHLLKDGNGPAYCSLGLGGKLGGSRSEADLGYDAVNKKRKWGRYDCASPGCFPGCDDEPLCGPDLGDEFVPENVQDLFRFVEATLVGPRDPGGNLIPGTVYTQSQPFMLWVASSLPHSPYKPPVAIEDRFRILPDYLFGESVANPGTPRFPFGDALYDRAFDPLLEKNFAGYYGNVWWGDDAIRHVRSYLEGIQVWDHTGVTAVSLWERTVFMLTADHGINLPRSKRNFTENGYRSPMVIHDARLAPSAAEPRVEQELTHSVDVLPTILDFAGHPVPPTRGVSLKSYLSGAPPVAPLRDLLCGHQTKGTKARTDRFARTRPGALGRCAPAGAGPACTVDADCGGAVCLFGECATGTSCLEDDDCTAGETCQHKTQKWCRFGRHPLDETAIPTVNLQPSVACTTEADCVADCPSSDPLHCTCEYREAKLYVLANGESRLMDLFVDPDEPGMDNRLRKGGQQPGDVPIGAGAPHQHVAERMRCCIDRWWTPPPTAQGVVLGNPACTGCEPNYACHRCGDGIVDSAEQCDGSNLGGKTCATVPGGFSGGTLSCTGACAFDTSGCTP
jgi:hypothetical protein